ncbi:MAG: divergent polysaccharide deacetylase family protein [Stappiaceae bacterium]
MAGDDLTAPLGLNKKGRFRFRPPLGLIGVAIVALLVAVFVGWIVVVDDPLGGEPHTVIALERTIDGVSARDMAVVGIQNKGADGSQVAALPASPEDLKNLAPPVSDAAELGPAGGLSTIPDGRVSEDVRHGVLPVKSADGLRPLDVYARPVANSGVPMPQIAIIVGGLGLSQTGSLKAIESLPADVTFGIAPYGNSLDLWKSRVRRQGHEMVIQVPMEPFDFPDNDPGPHTLLTSLPEATIRDRLHWVLGRTTNYVGVMNFMGARFMSSPDAMAPFLNEIKNRGLLLVDDGSSSRSLVSGQARNQGIPALRADLVLDVTPERNEIDARLLQLEAIARAKGTAIASASALPITIDRLAEWAKDLEERGLQLVPVSAALNSQLNSTQGQ